MLSIISIILASRSVSLSTDFRSSSSISCFAISSSRNRRFSSFLEAVRSLWATFSASRAVM